MAAKMIQKQLSDAERLDYFTFFNDLAKCFQDRSISLYGSVPAKLRQAADELEKPPTIDKLDGMVIDDQPDAIREMLIERRDYLLAQMARLDSERVARPDTPAQGLLKRFVEVRSNCDSAEYRETVKLIEAECRQLAGSSDSIDLHIALLSWYNQANGGY